MGLDSVIPECRADAATDPECPARPENLLRVPVRVDQIDKGLRCFGSARCFEFCFWAARSASSPVKHRVGNGPVGNQPEPEEMPPQLEIIVIDIRVPRVKNRGVVQKLEVAAFEVHLKT